MSDSQAYVRPSEPIGGSAAWRGDQLDARSDWHWQVGDDAFDGNGEPGPALRALAREISTALTAGPGVALLHGFPIDEPGVDERFLRFTGLLGTHVVQNRTSGLIRHIRDNGGSRVESPARLNFHTDRADLVALLTLSMAAEGGVSRIVSAVEIHDTLLRERPDLLQVLYEPFHRSSVG
ncbi:MAG: TauD/TfdA family dioxygenase, partial [Gammaproteobacteria bacterium]|nr:TauD/TfdA family dioxygenase [Gammaproteobacteria bacterium]